MKRTPRVKRIFTPNSERREAASPHIVLAVVTDPSADDESTWWYEGTGLVRHWWLHVAPSRLTLPVGDAGSIFVRADVPVGGITDGGRTGAGVRVFVTTFVVNGDATTPVSGAVATFTVRDAAGAAVSSVTAPLGLVPAGGNETVDVQIDLAAPSSLWAPDHPYIYALETRVALASGEPADDAMTRFGARLGVLTSDRGFVLNGVPRRCSIRCIHIRTQVKGFCQHEDVAGLGRRLRSASTAFVSRSSRARAPMRGARRTALCHPSCSTSLTNAHACRA